MFWNKKDASLFFSFAVKWSKTNYFWNEMELATLLKVPVTLWIIPSIPNSYKIKNGVKKAVKLENEVIILQRSVFTINVCKKNGQKWPILSKNSVFKSFTRTKICRPAVFWPEFGCCTLQILLYHIIRQQIVMPLR